MIMHFHVPHLAIVKSQRLWKHKHEVETGVLIFSGTEYLQLPLK